MEEGIRMERKVEIVSFESMTIEYSLVGEGEPVLVMHGGHSNCNEEFGYQALVKSGFSVITPSRPGYGRTSKKVGKDLAMACEYYVRLLDHLKIEKVHVLAISAGGPSGICLAASYPARIRTLTLQSAVTKEWLKPSDKEYKAARILFHPKMEKVTWRFVAALSNLFPRFIFKQMLPSFSKLTYDLAKDQISEGDVEAIRKMNNRQRSGFGFFLDLTQLNAITRDDLRAIACPTLIMHSKHDGSVPLDHAYYAQKQIGGSRLCILESWGHLIWIGTSSAVTDETVIGFLKSAQ